MPTTRLSGTLIKSGSIPVTALGGGVVSSSVQLAATLPAGTVSSSAQYPGWVTSSTQVVWSSVNYNSGIVSSSTQVKPLLPGGTVTSSAQYPGWVTASSQIDYNSITNKLSGVVSSSGQVQPLLPAGTVSSSTQFKTITDPFTGSFTGSFAGTHTGTFPYASLTGTPTLVSASSQIDYNSITNKLSGVVSSSAQIQPLLPGGTVSSSAQYPGWVTASSQIDYNSITNKLSGVYSSSAQVDAAIVGQVIEPTTVNATSILSGSVLQTGTNALIGGKLAVTGSTELTGTVTASNLTANQAVFTNASDGLVSNAITGTGNVVMSASPTLTGTITAANITATGTMLLAGIFSSSAQVDYNSIQNKLSGVVSSSAQVAPLLPAGTVSSSGQVTITATSGYSTFSSSIATKNDTQDISINALNAATSSYAINSTIQSQLAGVASSSAQVKAYLPGGTVSSSAQYPGWVTSSAQILLNTVAGTTFSNNSFYFPIDLRVEGNLTAQQIYTEYVSSSVIYESGSSKFGDTTDDVMSVTGSILVLGGRISGSMTGMFSASSQVDYNSITNKLSGVVSSSTQVQPLLPAGTVSSSAQYPGWVTASSQIDYNSITNKLSGVYSSSTQAVAAIAAQTIAPTTVNATNILSGSVLQTGTNALIGGKLAVTGAAEITGTVTASNLTANQAVFTNASDGLVSNAITGTGNVVMSASPTLTGTLTAANITANGTMLLQNIVSQSSAPSFTGLTSTGTVLLAGIYSSSAQTVAAIASQTIAPTTVNATSILSGSVLQTGTNALIGGKLAVTGSTELTGTVTASNLSANQAVFTNAVDGLVSNAITGTGNVVMSASPTLTGTITAASITATGTMLLAGIISSSTASTTGQGNVRVTVNGANTDVSITNLNTSGRPLFSGSQFSGIVSGSGLQYRLVVPVGTNYYAT